MILLPLFLFPSRTLPPARHPPSRSSFCSCPGQMLGCHRFTLDHAYSLIVCSDLFMLSNSTKLRIPSPQASAGM
jgi:hypothetical protein